VDNDAILGCAEQEADGDVGDQANILVASARDCPTLYNELFERGDLDAATAMLTLIKEYETSQRYTEHLLGVAYWGKIALFLQQYPPLSPLIPAINKIIGDYYSAVLYPTEDGDYSLIDRDILSHALAGKSF
jgi:hypothetical protein